MSKQRNGSFANYRNHKRNQRNALTAMLMADSYADLGPRCILRGRLQAVDQRFGTYEFQAFCLRDQKGDWQTLTPSAGLIENDFHALHKQEVEVVAVPEGRRMRVIKIEQVD